MAINTKLELRQTHSLVMTPQLQQAIKLLQLSNMELTAFVEAELERKVGQMTMEIDFLKKLLRSLEEQQETGNGSGSSTRKSAKKRKG